LQFWINAVTANTQKYVTLRAFRTLHIVEWLLSLLADPCEDSFQLDMCSHAMAFVSALFKGEMLAADELQKVADFVLLPLRTHSFITQAHLEKDEELLKGWSSSSAKERKARSSSDDDITEDMHMGAHVRNSVLELILGAVLYIEPPADAYNVRKGISKPAEEEQARRKKLFASILNFDWILGVFNGIHAGQKAYAADTQTVLYMLKILAALFQQVRTLPLPLSVNWLSG
jgi:hypothetical protein